MQAGTRRGRRRSTPRRSPRREAATREWPIGEVLLLDLVVTAGLLGLMAASGLGPGAGWLFLCAPVAGLITGGVSAYNRCALLSLLVLLACLTGFVLLFAAAPSYPGEYAYMNALTTWVWDAITGVTLIAGWAVGAIVGWLVQRSAAEPPRRRTVGSTLGVHGSRVVARRSNGALADSPAAVLGVWRVIGSEVDDVLCGDEVALGIDGDDLVITMARSGEVDRRELDALDAIVQPGGRTEVTFGPHVLLDLEPVAGATDRLVGVLRD
jgi:hypothetical protein